MRNILLALAVLLSTCSLAHADHWGHGGWGGGWGRGPSIHIGGGGDFGGGLLGGIIGGAIGNWLAPSPVVVAPPVIMAPPVVVAPVPEMTPAQWSAYCHSRYRSYDDATNTYMGYDGLRHACQ